MAEISWKERVKGLAKESPGPFIAFLLVIIIAPLVWVASDSEQKQQQKLRLEWDLKVLKLGGGGCDSDDAPVITVVPPPNGLNVKFPNRLVVFDTEIDLDKINTLHIAYDPMVNATVTHYNGKEIGQCPATHKRPELRQ